MPKIKDWYCLLWPSCKTPCDRALTPGVREVLPPAVVTIEDKPECFVPDALAPPERTTKEG